MLNDFNNEINELRSEYLAGKHKKIDDFMENAMLLYNKQLKFFDDYLINNKQKTPTRQISSEKSLKPGLSSISFLSQATIVERKKLKPRGSKQTGTGLKILTPNKLLSRLPILLGQVKAEKNSKKLKNEIKANTIKIFCINTIKPLKTFATK